VRIGVVNDCRFHTTNYVVHWIRGLGVRGYQTVTKYGFFEEFSGVDSETTEGVSQSKCNDITGSDARALGHQKWWWRDSVFGRQRGWQVRLTSPFETVADFPPESPRSNPWRTN
jgi:hypothetical protein